MKYDIPGYGELEIKTIILDLNGSVSVGGIVVEGVSERIRKLKDAGFKLVLFTGNTRNDADELANELGVEWVETRGALAKKEASDSLDPSTCASIGNGLIDRELTENVALGIVVLQAEGIHIKTLLVSDVVVPGITDALDLFIDEKRLVATLRR
jgi:soluble P-type ATPase